VRKGRAALTQQWTRSVADELAVAEGCYFDLEAGQYVVDFFEQFFCHTLV
jgi:hypothetical protein